MAVVEFNQQRLRKSVRQMSKICGKAGKKARNPVPTNGTDQNCSRHQKQRENWKKGEEPGTTIFERNDGTTIFERNDAG